MDNGRDCIDALSIVIESSKYRIVDDCVPQFEASLTSSTERNRHSWPHAPPFTPSDSDWCKTSI